MLEARNVSQLYGEKEALKSVNLKLAGGITGLLGPKGAGKTTLLRTLAFVRPPDRGDIFFRGRQIGSDSQARAARQALSYLPQNFTFDPRTKLRDFVTYAAWMRGVGARLWPEAVTAALAAVDLVNESVRPMGKLSGGMRQRAGIAAALVSQPSVVLLDEPTVGLDPAQRIKFRETIAALDLSTVTVVLSTHITEDVSALCDRVLVMSSGSIKFDGAISELVALDPGGGKAHTAIEGAYVHLIGAANNEF